jgi:hypothetical protein
MNDCSDLALMVEIANIDMTPSSGLYLGRAVVNLLPKCTLLLPGHNPRLASWRPEQLINAMHSLTT